MRCPIQSDDIQLTTNSVNHLQLAHDKTYYIEMAYGLARKTRRETLAPGNR